jgi:hypothetical protein
MYPLHLTAFALLVLTTASAVAQQPAGKLIPAVRPVSPDVVAQHNRIQRLLPAATKEKMSELVPAFGEQILRLPLQVDYQDLAAAEVRKTFPGASAQQVYVLTFDLLKLTLDNTSEIDPRVAEQLRTAMANDKRSKLLETLSNMMKKISDTKYGVIQNLK